MPVDLLAEQPKKQPRDLFAEGDWERAVLLPMETNKATGERRWAVPGFIDAAIEAVKLPGDVMSGEANLDPRLSYKDVDPETLDRASVLAGGVGAELPLAARGMVAPSARVLVDSAGARMPKLVADELDAANVAPSMLQRRLAELGPAAVIGDLSPRLQARIGAIANTPGPGQDMVIQALMARQRGANARISTAVDETLGPAPIPSREAAAIRAQQLELSPEYQAALANATSGDISPVVRLIEDGIMEAKGPARSALQRVRSMLDFEVPSVPGVPDVPPMLDPNPSGWLRTRQAIDGMLDGETNTDVIRVLTQARRAIDDALTQHVPGIKEVDARFAELARQNEALTQGQQLLDSGRTAVRPAELAEEFAAATPEVRERMRQGVRAEIERLIGTTANDRVALKGLVKGDGSWNRERLVTLYGEERAQRLIDLFDAEAVMQQTENLAFGNSKTEIIRSAKEGIEPRQSGPGIVRSAGNLQFGDAAAKVVDRALGGALSAARRRQNELTAAALLSRSGWSPSGAATTTLPGLAPLSNIAVLDALIERGKQGGLIGR